MTGLAANCLCAFCTLNAAVAREGMPQWPVKARGANVNMHQIVGGSGHLASRQCLEEGTFTVSSVLFPPTTALFANGLCLHRTEVRWSVVSLPPDSASQARKLLLARIVSYLRKGAGATTASPSHHPEREVLFEVQSESHSSEGQTDNLKT